MSGDRRDEIVVACWEGVFVLDRNSEGRWTKTRLGTGNQDFRAVQRVERSQGRPAAVPRTLCCDDRALAWISGRRVHESTPEFDSALGLTTLVAAGDRRANAMGARRLDRQSG